jgi:small subunit ribosomal protein S18
MKGDKTMAETKRGPSRDYSDKEGRGVRPRRTRRKVCTFCADKIEHIDFKDIAKLRKFISERGKILPKRMSGNCARHQRELTIAIKRARHIAFLPYSGE